MTHHLQLFDTPASFSDALFDFVCDGLRHDEAVIAIVTRPHWAMTQRRARLSGLDIDSPLADGRLTVQDAEITLSRLRCGDDLSWAAFSEAVERLVQRAPRGTRRVRVYGEMVDLLVRQNRFDAAERLEEFWNVLVLSNPVLLQCGYSSEHFGNPRDAESLRRICRLHSRAHADAHDVLGRFLLKTHAAC